MEVKDKSLVNISMKRDLRMIAAETGINISSVTDTMVPGEPDPNAISASKRGDVIGQAEIYCDAAWVENSGKAGFGVLIKNCAGVTVVEHSSSRFISFALSAEIWAIWNGVHLVKHLELVNAVVFSDSLKAINFLNKTHKAPWYLIDLIRDI
ncbi:hypothetical protein Cni_G08820 [Canna indica]|uniref:RNase H type-1 domain-containing protein n=1 Tax=Canna indica TaxID=4628 RepID=A0AAQ3K4Q1_9LILI|nr:hypothetical protein Cni_G08820 [Canna indica]